MYFDYNTTNDLVYISENGINETLLGFYAGRETAFASEVDDYQATDSPIIGCGPRCGPLNITQIPNYDEDDSEMYRGAYLYSCNSTVHQVEGAENEKEFINDEIALLAATAPSHSGFWDPEGRLYGYYPKT